MNKSKVFVIHLQDILEKRGITQKEFASMIEERPATISEFVNFRRTTINMDLFLKIATALDVKDVNELISLKDVFIVKDYDQNRWYNFNDRVKFSYQCDSHKEVFELAEVLDNGTLLHQRYPIEELNDRIIEERYNALNKELTDNSLHDDVTLMLIELTRYEGEQILVTRFKAVKEAVESLELLF